MISNDDFIDPDLNGQSDETPDYDSPDSDYELRHCERCHALRQTQLIPLMGYSEYLCVVCATIAYETGDAI